MEFEIKAVIRGIKLSFKTTHGLFSFKEIDKGTRLLIESVELRPFKNILEIGCGYGAVGTTLAKMFPDAHIDMLDRDFVAIQYAKENIKINNLDNAEAFLSNVFSEIPERKYDLIVSNLPSHISHTFLTEVFSECLNHLSEGGVILIGGVSKISKFYLKEMDRIFGNSAKVAERDKFTVIQSELS